MMIATFSKRARLALLPTGVSFGQQVFENHNAQNGSKAQIPIIRLIATRINGLPENFRRWQKEDFGRARLYRTFLPLPVRKISHCKLSDY